MTTETTQIDAEVTGELVDGQGNAISVEDAVKLKQEGNKEPEKPVDRPAWLPEKFKTPEDLGKSYTELEKMLHEKGKVAPESYTIDDEKEVEGLDKEGDIFKKFQETSKAANLNNAQFNAVLKFAKEAGYLEAPPSYEDEMAALGTEGPEIIDRLTRFASTRLTADEKSELEGLVLTAKSARVLDKIIRMSDRSIPLKPGESQVSSKRELETELQNVLQNPNIRHDYLLKQKAEELSKRIAEM